LGVYGLLEIALSGFYIFGFAASSIHILGEFYLLISGFSTILFAITSVLSLLARVINFKWYLPFGAVLVGFNLFAGIHVFLRIKKISRFLSGLQVFPALKHYILTQAELAGCQVVQNKLSCVSIEPSIEEFCLGVFASDPYKLMLCGTSEIVAHRLRTGAVFSGVALLVAGLAILLHSGIAVWLNLKRPPTAAGKFNASEL
jgi:hypothetical protein